MSLIGDAQRTGLAAGREFEKLKNNNIMKINSDIQLKLQGQALLAANPLLCAATGSKKRYQIIYADPAWEYDTKECLAKTSILDGDDNKHYSTLTMAELKKLNVQSISDTNCLLFIWVVSPMLDEGIEVLKSWGFKYATIAFVWHKQKVNPGHYTMSECEICLVGKRGSIPTPRGERNIRQFLSMGRGKHSEKPPEIRKRIEAMFPTQTKVELFARSRGGFWSMDEYEGWDVWGNQVERSIKLETSDSSST